MSLLRQAGRVAWKDLRIELRSREIVYTMVFFGALLVVIYSFAFPKDARAVRGSVPGMLWVAIAFTGTIGLGRAFDRERENDTMRALLLLDEPFTGLDRDGALALGEQLGVLRDAGAIVVVVTHDLEAIAGRTDHVAILRRGQLVFEERGAYSYEKLKDLYHSHAN